MSELLPCRFCGGTDLNRFEHHKFAGYGPKRHRAMTVQMAQCKNCFAEASVEVWNSSYRPSPWGKAQGVKYCGRCGKCLDNACCECEEASQ